MTVEQLNELFLFFESIRKEIDSMSKFEEIGVEKQYASNSIVINSNHHSIANNKSEKNTYEEIL